ncbi:MAG: hypothetical protein RMK65_02975, partial [Anaerolineae bacterium]|nr:hypothetical protein [Anaerolineae bacterium]
MGNPPLWALGAERRPSPTLTGRRRPTAAKGQEGRLESALWPHHPDDRRQEDVVPTARHRHPDMGR